MRAHTPRGSAALTARAVVPGTASVHKHRVPGGEAAVLLEHGGGRLEHPGLHVHLHHDDRRVPERDQSGRVQDDPAGADRAADAEELLHGQEPGRGADQQLRLHPPRPQPPRHPHAPLRPYGHLALPRPPQLLQRLVCRRLRGLYRH
eukprot:1732451-Rhodomonas_salina.3